MKFVRIGNISEGVGPLREQLSHDLADAKHILWLVSGGSNIPLSVAVMAQLPDELTRGLSIMLADERFGPVGHADSNAQQLMQAGFLTKQANFIPVLKPNLSLSDTCKLYGEDFSQAVRAADIVIGQFGMGTDGHIAGILPGSAAVSSGDMTISYAASDYTRLTLTPKALQKLTVAYVFAFGHDKLTALEKLESQTLSLDVQPAQLIKQIPGAYVYNDQIG